MDDLIDFENIHYLMLKYVHEVFQRLISEYLNIPKKLNVLLNVFL